MLVALVRQCFEEGDDGIHTFILQCRAVFQLFQCQVFGHFRLTPGLSGLGIGGTCRVVVLVVEQHHGAQILEYAVVHIGAGDGDIAQRRYLELACLGRIIDDRIVEQAAIDKAGRHTIDGAQFGIHWRSYVAVLVIGESFIPGARAGTQLMALIAVGELLGEKQQTAQFFLIGQLGFTAQKAVIFGIKGGKKVGLLERSQAVAHRDIGLLGPIENTGTIKRIELMHVLRIFLQPVYDAGLIGHAHLNRVQRWAAGLFGQRGGTAIPELAAGPLAIRLEVKRRTQGCITDRRRIAVTE